MLDTAKASNDKVDLDESSMDEDEKTIGSENLHNLRFSYNFLTF